MTKHGWFADAELDRSLAEVLTLEPVGSLRAATEVTSVTLRLGRSRNKTVLSAASLVVAISVGTALILNGGSDRAPAERENNPALGTRVAITRTGAQATELAAKPVGKLVKTSVAPFTKRLAALTSQPLATPARESPRAKLAYSQVPTLVSITKRRAELADVDPERTIHLDRARIGVVDAPLPLMTEPPSSAAPSAGFQISTLSAEILINPGQSSAELVHQKRSRRDSVDAMRLLRRQ